MKEIYVFGHKKPDTDSVTSAISFSNLQSKAGIKCTPMILDNINKETEFVLNYFNIPVPKFLDNVKIQIKNINYKKDCFVFETDSIKKMYDYMCDKNITGVPVVDKNKNLKGLVTSKMIVNSLINGEFTKLSTNYENIIDVLNGEKILKFDDEINGELTPYSFDSYTFLDNLTLRKDTILIVGNRANLIKSAIESKVKLIILVENTDISDELVNFAMENKVNIIKTNLDTFNVTRMIINANYVKNILSNSRNSYFNENDYYDDFKEQCSKLGYNNYPVIDNKGKCLGLIRITDIKNINKKQVILVDHNEMDQSVDGIEEAEIIGIIDHHKIGNLSTNMPIDLRNMIVGSTNTIIYLMYKERNVEIDKSIAGIMLAGILSDTLKFTSPTTTEYDRKAAIDLSNISGINIDEFSFEMFKVGTNLSGKTLEQIIDNDMKVFDISDKKISISQVITLNSKEILDKKEEYINKINEIKKNRSYDYMILCITDLLDNGSYILFDDKSTTLIKNAFDLEEIKEGFFIKGCLSRKKQIVPLIASELEN